MKNNVLALVAAVVGGVVGYFGFFWIVQQGFYAMVLPGGLVGLAASYFRSRSIAVWIACGVLALAAGLVTEWRFAPFKVDASLGYFLAHVYQLRPLTLLMIALGTGIGCWLPYSSHRANSR